MSMVYDEYLLFIIVNFRVRRDLSLPVFLQLDCGVCHVPI